MTFLIFLAVLIVLVLVHEAGHFFAARWGGVAVEEFGFGFPPRATGIQRGKTFYSLNWLPLGGFVRLKGEEGDCAQDADSFAHASIGRRFWIVAAGVTMNVFLATVLLAILFSTGLTVPIEGVYIDGTIQGTPAEAAGLKTGDRVRAVDGVSVETIDAFQKYIAAHGGQSVTLTVEEITGSRRSATLTPTTIEGLATPGIGIQLATEGIVKYPWYRAIWEAILATLMILWEILRAFGLLIKNLVTEWQVGADISGPIGIAIATGKVASHGFNNLLYFIALLSLNLAVINVLPIPALDGGRLFFLIIEKIRGRAVSKEFEKRVHIAGFSFLLLLVVLVTARDLMIHGGTLFQGIRNLFPI